MSHRWQIVAHSTKIRNNAYKMAECWCSWLASPSIMTFKAMYMPARRGKPRRSQGHRHGWTQRRACLNASICQRHPSICILNFFIFHSWWQGLLMSFTIWLNSEFLSVLFSLLALKYKISRRCSGSHQIDACYCTKTIFMLYFILIMSRWLHIRND